MVNPVGYLHADYFFHDELALSASIRDMEERTKSLKPTETLQEKWQCTEKILLETHKLIYCLSFLLRAL
jgi:hypothetical protein